MTKIYGDDGHSAVFRTLPLSGSLNRWICGFAFGYTQICSAYASQKLLLYHNCYPSSVFFHLLGKWVLRVFFQNNRGFWKVTNIVTISQLLFISPVSCRDTSSRCILKIIFVGTRRYL